MNAFSSFLWNVGKYGLIIGTVVAVTGLLRLRISVARTPRWLPASDGGADMPMLVVSVAV